MSDVTDRIVGTALAADSTAVFCVGHQPDAVTVEVTVDHAMRAGQGCGTCGRDLVGPELADVWRKFDTAQDLAIDASDQGLTGEEEQKARYQAWKAARAAETAERDLLRREREAERGADRDAPGLEL